MKIFYSWQSDKHIPNNVNRSFIEKALENAAKAIRRDETIEIVPVIDRDTVGFSGSPNIPQTILQKIDEADVFVCDVTIINSSKKYRLTPNPNVLFELGYAVQKLGWDRIIMVMNEAFGDVNKLPFDLEKRRTFLYNLAENVVDKVTTRIGLEKRIESALRLIGEKMITLANPETEIIQETDSTNLFLLEAHNLAKQSQFKQLRDKWFYSQNGVNDVLNSINEIFGLIDANFSNNSEIFSQLGITLHKENYLRSVQTFKVGSQIELKNHDQLQISNLSNVVSLWLLLVLYEKTPLYNGMFTTKAIDELYFAPDLNSQMQIVWKNKKNESEMMTAKQLSEKCFEILIKKIQQKPKLDELVPGGRYLVDGKFVNANGQEIE